MLRRLPPIILFLFVSLIGIFVSTLAGLLNEFGQQPFSATNAVVWLFLMVASGSLVTLIVFYARR